MTRPAHRRKEVPCVLCGEGTYAPEAVCGACRRAVEVGRAILEYQAAATAPEQVIRIQAHLSLSRYDGTPDDDADDRLSRALPTLMGARKVEGQHWYDEKAPLYGRSPRGSETTWEHYIVRQGSGEALADVISAIRDWAAHQYACGFEDGNNLIARLASGDLSMADVADVDQRKSNRNRR